MTLNKKLRTVPATLVLFFLIILAACDNSNEPEPIPDTGSISGTVTFVGTWPASGNIQVSVYQTLAPPFVPTGPPEQATDPIAANTTTYNFKFEGLEKTTYAAVFVGWRDPANPAASRLLGMYWAYPDSVGINPQNGLPLEQPRAITIDDDHIEVTNINIKADLNLAP